MGSSAGQKGEGRGGCLVGLTIFAAVLFVAYKVVPVKVRAAELRQTVINEARAAGSRPDDVIRKTILAKAHDLQMPVNPKDLTIQRFGDNIKVDLRYTIPIVFPGYTYQYSQHHSAENPIF